MPTAQNFRNHARIVPAYHVGVFVPFLANFIWATYRLIGMFSGETFIAFLVSIALLLMFFSLRVQVLTVQDRVIRLEMRLRLRNALPPDLQDRDQRPVAQTARRAAVRQRRRAGRSRARGARGHAQDTERNQSSRA